MAQNLLLWVECKSYLYSRGVTIASFTDKNDKGADRYKVFTRPDYRRIVSEELVNQVVASQMALPNPMVKYCLVAGRIATESDCKKLHQYFEEQGWLLYDDKWIRQGLEKASAGSYEDDIAVIVAKLFSRYYD